MLFLLQSPLLLLNNILGVPPVGFWMRSTPSLCMRMVSVEPLEEPPLLSGGCGQATFHPKNPTQRKLMPMRVGSQDLAEVLLAPYFPPNQFL